MQMHEQNAWSRRLDATYKAQEAGENPDSMGMQIASEKRRQPPRARRFVRAAERILIAAVRTASGFLEFCIWLGINLVILLVIILAAQATGAHLPPWLITTANFIQALLARVAQALGLGV